MSLFARNHLPQTLVVGVHPGPLLFFLFLLVFIVGDNFPGEIQSLLPIWSEPGEPQNKPYLSSTSSFRSLKIFEVFPRKRSKYLSYKPLLWGLHLVASALVNQPDFSGTPFRPQRIDLWVLVDHVTINN